MILIIRAENHFSLFLIIEFVFNIVCLLFDVKHLSTMVMFWFKIEIVAKFLDVLRIFKAFDALGRPQMKS